MTYSEITYAAQDGVAVVTLNRPDKLNAWTSVMEREVRAAMRAASDDDAVKVIVLTGAGRGFCAGADMGTLTSIQSGGGRRPRPPGRSTPTRGPTSPRPIPTSRACRSRSSRP